MSDFLGADEVEELMKEYLVVLWTSDLHQVLYFQQAKTGEVEIYANTAAASTMGRRQLGSCQPDQLSSWIAAFESNGRLHTVAFAGQALYSSALQQALDHGWKARVQRLARKGDCQALSNFGTQEEETAAGRIFKQTDPSVRQIVITEVLGTALLFVEANFCFDDNEFFGNCLKSCRPENEVYERVIPQLVAAKGLKQVLFTDSALAERACGEPRNRAYLQMFSVFGDPDLSVNQQRDQLRERLASYTSVFPPSAQQASTTGWLDAARIKFGLARRAVIPAVSGSGVERCMLRIYLELEQAEVLEEVQSLSNEAQALALSSSADRRLKVAVQLLAKAKQGVLSRDDVTQVLLPGCDESDLWWDAIIRATTTQWLRSNQPDDWIALIGERAPKVLQDLSRKDSEHYGRIRAAFAEALGSDRLQAIFPFQTYESELAVGKNYREFRDNLDKALLHSPGADDGRVRVDPSDMRKGHFGFHHFYTHLVLSGYCYDEETAQELLDKAHRLWGDSSQHYHAQVEQYLRHDYTSDALGLCKRWLSEYEQDADAWYCMGEIQNRQQDYAQARESFQHSAARAEHKYRARLEASRCLCRMGRSDEGAFELRALIDVDPGPEARVLLGNILWSNEQHAEAMALYRPLDIGDIDAYGGLAPYLLSLFDTEGWEAVSVALDQNFARLGNFEKQIVVYSLATALQGTGRAHLVHDYLIDLLLFDEGWEAAVYIVAECCLACGDCGTGREILGRALTSPCAAEFLSVTLAQSFMYTIEPKDQDLLRCFETCQEGLEQYPEAYDLCNLAGQTAVYAQQDGEAYFLRALALLNETPASEHSLSSILSQAISLCNLQRVNEAIQILDGLTPSDVLSDLEALLYRALLACAAQAADVPQHYQTANQQLRAAEPNCARSGLQRHLTDLQLYGMRGLIPDWHARQISAQTLYQGINT